MGFDILRVLKSVSGREEDVEKWRVALVPAAEEESSR